MSDVIQFPRRDSENRRRIAELEARLREIDREVAEHHPNAGPSHPKATRPHLLPHMVDEVNTLARLCAGPTPYCDKNCVRCDGKCRP